MTDKLHEGIMHITLKNKSTSGKSYEINNLIGNIKVGVERLEEVVSMLDFTNLTVKVKRDPDNYEIIVFDLYVKGLLIGSFKNDDYNL
jgi:hypothetical protein